MDTSETYIKMCEKAEEIQGSILKIDKIGIVMYIQDIPREYCPECDGLFSSKYCPDCGVEIVRDEAPYKVSVYNIVGPFHRGIWLPRQDQLQGMIGDSIYNNIKNAMFSVLDDIHKFAYSSNFLDYIPLTMEQLWLAFVMKEKYNKIWNSEDWIEEK